MNSNNPIIILSFVNTKLRDFYDSFEKLCEDLDLNKEEIEKTLNNSGYFYDEKLNQFK